MVKNKWENAYPTRQIPATALQRADKNPASTQAGSFAGTSAGLLAPLGLRAISSLYCINEWLPCGHGHFLGVASSWKEEWQGVVIKELAIQVACGKKNLTQRVLTRVSDQ